MKSLRPTAAVLLLAAFAGCGGPPYRADEKPADRVATIDTTVLVLLDDTARWAFELIDHRVQALPDGRLGAQIRFRNKSTKDLHVQLCWTFKDDRNFAVEPDSPFEHALIAAGRTVDLSRQSIAAGATGFSLQIRTAVPAGQ